jgi:cysteine-rich repeat protein
MNIINGNCVCPLPTQYYNITQSNCLACNNTCLTCLNSTSCLTCDTSKFRMKVDVMCLYKYNYQENNTFNCVPVGICIAGYTQQGVICYEICGDGLLFELACDDGNNIDGDGCSTTCVVETNFTCIDGSPTSPSKCSYNQPLVMNLILSYKNLYANAVNFTISIDNLQTLLVVVLDHSLQLSLTDSLLCSLAMVIQ